MRDPGGGGTAADSSYATFVGDLYEKLNRFAELYADKTSTTRTSMYEIPPTTEEVEAASDISSYVRPFLGASDTTSLVEAIAPDTGLINNLETSGQDSNGRDPIAGSRIETALGYIEHGLESWEGQDATQFHVYLGQVRLALHRQEVLLDALHALADVHRRIVERTRADLLDLLDAANEALADYGSWGGNETKKALTIIGAAFAIGATMATGGAAAGLTIAGTLAMSGSSLIPGSNDEIGDGRAYNISGDSEEIRSTTIGLIDELKTDVDKKNSDLRQSVSQLCDIISSGGGGISADDLLPLKPDVYENQKPERFKLPVYIPVEP